MRIAHLSPHTPTPHPPGLLPAAEEKKEKKEALAAAGGGGGEEGGEAEEEEDSEEEAAAAPGGGASAQAAAASTATPSSSASSAAPRYSADMAALLAAPRDAAARAAAKKACAGARQVDLFVALEHAALLGGAASLKAVPIALEGLYDGDVVSEEGVLAWHAGVEGSAEVKSRAAPFVVWLQEADEEEEEE